MRKQNLHYVFSFIFLLFIGLNAPLLAQETGQIQEGSATWYGSRYHGKRTSSGEIFNKNRLTAAHPSLPFGTKVKVTHAGTNKTVVVRINDRGPFGTKGHIIDLSEAAARKIGLYQSGYAQVNVEVVSELSLERDIAAISARPLRLSSHEFKALDQDLLGVLPASRTMPQAVFSRKEPEQIKTEKQGILTLIRKLYLAS